MHLFILESLWKPENLVLQAQVSSLFQFVMHNKPRRSSIRLCPEPRKSDSLFETATTRRVSFSRTILVCGAEMQVSQIPLSRVSDESIEGTKPDGSIFTMQWDTSIPEVSMELEPISMHMDQPVAGLRSSQLHEINKVDDPQADLLQDTVTCDMSVDSNNEMPTDSYTELKPVANETCYSMELCLDSDTPKKTMSRTVDNRYCVPSTQCETEMDISTVTATSENEPTEITLLQSDCGIASETSYAISPIPPHRAANYPSFELKKPNACQNSESSEPLNKLIAPVAHLRSNGEDSNKTFTEFSVVSPEKVQVEHSVETSAQKITHPIDADHADVLTPMTKAENQELFLRSANRRILCSLPPLRHDTISRHPEVHDSVRSKVCHTLIGTREEANHRQRLFGRLNLKVDDRIMSQSLATTPLRQVTPKDWIQATAVQRGDSLSKYGVSGLKRYEPQYLMPSVSRLQGQVVRLASYPVPKSSDYNVLTNLRDLQDFLDRNANVTSENESICSAHSTAAFKRIIQDQLYCSILNEELLHNLRAVCLSNQCRIQWLANMYIERQSKVLLQNFLESTVVKQLNEMSVAQRFDFVAQAHERLHQCSQLSQQEFREMEVANIEAVQTEKESAVNLVRQFEEELDSEISQLEAELNKNQTALRELRDASQHLKDSESKLNAIVQETERVKSKKQTVRSTNKQLFDKLTKCISLIGHDIVKDNDCTILGVPGATELFIPWNALATNTATRSSSDAKGPQDSSAQEISNLFSPSDVLCLSYEDQMYAVRTLFGLVQIILSCHPIHLMTTGRTVEKPTIKPENLIIQTVNVRSPPNGLAPVDCPAVEALADFVIRLCNSREGRNEFCSKLVGLTLERAVWYIEYVMTPYFLLAGDMRAIFLAGHSVEFECTSPPSKDISFTTPSGQRSLLLSRSALSLSAVAVAAADSSVSKSTCMFDQNLMERLNPTGPFNITVQLRHRDTLTILVLRIILPSLESDDDQSPDTSVKVVLGRLSSDDVQRLEELCKVYPGHIYSAVQAVERSLAEMYQQ